MKQNPFVQQAVTVFVVDQTNITLRITTTPTIRATEML